MKRKRTLLICGGVLVALCGGIAIEKAAVRHVDSINNVEEEILALDPAEVTSVNWTKDDVTLSFTRDDSDQWGDPEDAAFPTNQDKVEELLEHFQSVNASFIITDVEDYGEYGLDEPDASIEFTTADKTYTMKFGTYSTIDSKRYVQLEEGTVYLIDDDLANYLYTDRDNFIQNDTFYKYSNLKQIDIQIDADEEAVAAAKEAAKEDGTTASIVPKADQNLTIQYLPDEQHVYSDAWDYYLVDGDEYKALNTSYVTTWLNKLTGGDLSEYVTYDATEEDVTACGLDNPVAVITVSGSMNLDTDIEETDAENIEITSEKDSTDADSDEEGENSSSAEDSEEPSEEEAVPESYVVRISNPAEGEYYMRKDDSRIIYKLSQANYEALTGVTYNTLRPTVVVYLDWSKVQTFSMTDSTASYEVVLHHDESTGETTYTYGDKDVDLTETSNDLVLLEIRDYDMEDVAEEVAAALEIDPENTFVITQENDFTTELKIECYQYNGTDVVVKLNGELLGLMSRESMVNLKEAMLTAVLS